MTPDQIALFLSAFAAFFVVIDAVGVTPIFAGLTDGAPAAHRRAMAFRSVLIAGVILVFFALLGQATLDALHVSLDAFRAAGGLMLLLIALDMVFERRQENRRERAEEHKAHLKGEHAVFEDISVFPMAIPMLAGPGSIALVMLYMGEAEGLTEQIIVFSAIGANLVLALLLFLGVGLIMRLLGATVVNMITRVLGVLLAALAAQLIFDGVRNALFT